MVFSTNSQYKNIRNWFWIYIYTGFNITVIAYGQTGSGKTFTVFGPGLLYTMNESDFGLVPRTVRHLFYKAKVLIYFFNWF